MSSEKLSFICVSLCSHVIDGTGYPEARQLNVMFSDIRLKLDELGDRIIVGATTERTSNTQYYIYVPFKVTVTLSLPAALDTRHSYIPPALA